MRLRGFRRTTCVSVLACGLVLAGPATAQLSVDWQACAKSDTSPDDGIAACTAIIESGLERGQNLSIALFNRANGWLAKGELDRAVADLSGAIGLDGTQRQGILQSRQCVGSARRASSGPSRTSARRSGSMRISSPPMAAAASRISKEATSTVQSSISTTRSGLRRRTHARSPPRGTAWRAKGEFDLALADFGRAIEAEPNDANARNERGVTLHRGRPVRSRAHRFRRSNPARSKARVRLRKSRPCASDPQQFRRCHHRFRRGASARTRPTQSH